MVASSQHIQLAERLSRRKLLFARSLAHGATQAEAYQSACRWPVPASTASTMGCKWAALPSVKAKVRELQDAADTACVLRLTEAQRLLADTARTSPRADPTHTDRIAAIKAHAELSGWTKRDEGLTINLNAVLGQLGPPVRPVQQVELDNSAQSPPTPVREQSLSPTRQPLPIGSEGVGCPNDGALLRAMHPNPQRVSSEAVFTIAPSLVPPEKTGRNPVAVFTNELGEMEEVSGA